MAIELQSLTLFVLAALKRDSAYSTEAGLKYFVLGAVSSGLFLFGCALLYGFTGETSIQGINSVMSGDVGQILISISLLFKLTGAAVPGFTGATTTSSSVLTGGHPCSEIIIYNRTGGNITVFDNEYPNSLNGFLLSAGETFTFRGLTNVAQVSATAASAGNIHYRAQYYSSNPSR